MDPKLPAMMTVNINFVDHGIVILKNSGDRFLNMFNVLWKKLRITLPKLPRRANKFYLNGMATQYSQ